MILFVDLKNVLLTQNAINNNSTIDFAQNTPELYIIVYTELGVSDRCAAV